MDEVRGPPPEHLSSRLMRRCWSLFDDSPQPTVAIEGLQQTVFYHNSAFVRLIGKHVGELVGRPFGEIVPESMADGCLAFLERVQRTATPEVLEEQEHHRTPLAFWSYSAWPIPGTAGHPSGVLLQVTDATEFAIYRTRAAAMNEALMVSSVRQHELTAATELLNSRLLEAHNMLERRVEERTAELASTNVALRTEIKTREATEANRQVLLGQLVTAQEHERRRIARELHDSVGQWLTALALGLKGLQDTSPLPAPIEERLADLKKVADELSRAAHDLAGRLRPTALDDAGLHAAVSQHLADWASRTGVEVDYEATAVEVKRLPPEIETVVYRVVQEALTNVARHARARRVSVVVGRFNAIATVAIEDDGVGFDLESAAASGRHGLLGMRERVTLAGGTLDVESYPGGGTTVLARFPLPVSEGSVVNKDS